MRKIILASGSPRRQELLKKTGLKFTVEPSGYEEAKQLPALPRVIAIRTSLEKARIVSLRHRNAIVIGADTFGVLKNEIIGKPHSLEEARKMLEKLNGKSHSVITGFTIIDSASGKTLSSSVETTVHIRKLTAEEIDSYVQTGEPLDKAGGYAIQGLGAFIVDRIDGDFYNVVGLPLSPLSIALEEFGVKIL
jgi:septum formation protein